MSSPMEYSEYPVAAADAGAAARAAFIRNTYAHLAGAIAAFIGVEFLLLKVPALEGISLVVVEAAQYSWLLVLGAFMVVSWVAQRWAQSDTSRGLQYLGLATFVAAEAVLFLPLLYYASRFYPDAIPTAGILTFTVAAGLTLGVFVTRGDYSHIRPILTIGSLVAFGAILAGCLFGFSLGLFFCFAMVALASGYIVYDTSNVLHHYRTDQHVAASLCLFADIALLFWYVLQILLLRGRD